MKASNMLYAAMLALTVLLAFFAVQFALYQRLAGEVNARWSVPDPRVYVTPSDPAVIATVNAVTYGKTDPLRDEDLRLYLRMLYDWVSVNVKPSPDPLYPMLPVAPSGQVSFINEVWQYPNETLRLRSGDCEDAATLLLSMVRVYAPRLKAACILVEGSKGGHVAVLVVKDGKVAILDPGLYYCTIDRLGYITFRSLVEELDGWLPRVMEKVGADAKVTALFNEGELARFRSTNEFVAYFNLHFKLQGS